MLFSAYFATRGRVGQRIGVKRRVYLITCFVSICLEVPQNSAYNNDGLLGQRQVKSTEV